MALSFQDIRYGWVALVGIVITGTTIFVASNQRQQVEQIDVIEIALGAYERCLATKRDAWGGTYKPQYIVQPPSYVREWTDASGTVYSVTNAIGWQIDRSMMTNLDTIIKELVPYYIDETDTNNNLTVTGLWARLSIGDGTNEFTSIPATGTNNAQYGTYSWQLYSVALEERYKVLNAMERIRPEVIVASGSTLAPKSNQVVVAWGLRSSPLDLYQAGVDVTQPYGNAKAKGDIAWTNLPGFASGTEIEGTPGYPQIWNRVGFIHIPGALPQYYYPRMQTAEQTRSFYIDYSNYGANTNTFFWAYTVRIRSVKSAVSGNTTNEWSAQGAVGFENVWQEVFSYTNIIINSETVGDYPMYLGGYSAGSTNYQPLWGEADFADRGNEVEESYTLVRYTGTITNIFGSVTNFYYCTNAYW